MKNTVKPHQDKIHPLIAVTILLRNMILISIVDSSNNILTN